LTLAEIKQLYDENIMGTYGRAEVAFVRGRGCTLVDSQGNEWLDCLAGIAVCGLGHSHPAVVQAVADQAERLMHTSNLYYIPTQAEAAAELTSTCELDRVFFGNSGAEAIEASIKLARKWGKQSKSGAYKIVAAEASFHGRTLCSLTATGQPKYQEAFKPLVPGFVHVPFGDIGAMEQAIDDETVAVLLEPIQGESGVRIPPDGYLAEVRALCDRHSLVMILDEIQTGLGRTGKWFAHQHEDIVPDVMAVSKALGAGFPIGACMARGEFADVLVPGDHASTFGGNHLGCAAVTAFLRTMKSDRVVENAQVMGNYAVERLTDLAAERPGAVKEIRAKGLMIAMELTDGVARQVLASLHGRRVLANAIGDHILRILPPLIIGPTEIERFIEALSDSLDEAGATGAP
jgi:predicted acetylornithine/succinylornithine family transaminase